MSKENYRDGQPSGWEGNREGVIQSGAQGSLIVGLFYILATQICL